MEADQLRRCITCNIDATSLANPTRSLMEISTDTLLTANALILQHGAGAEEYAAQKLWDSRNQGSTMDAAHWTTLLEALKRVREIQAMTKRGS